MYLLSSTKINISSRIIYQNQVRITSFFSLSLSFHISNHCEDYISSIHKKRVKDTFGNTYIDFFLLIKHTIILFFDNESSQKKPVLSPEYIHLFPIHYNSLFPLKHFFLIINLRCVHIISIEIL